MSKIVKLIFSIVLAILAMAVCINASGRVIVYSPTEVERSITTTDELSEFLLSLPVSENFSDGHTSTTSYDTKSFAATISEKGSGTVDSIAKVTYNRDLSIYVTPDASLYHCELTLDSEPLDSASENLSLDLKCDIYLKGSRQYLRVSEFHAESITFGMYNNGNKTESFPAKYLNQWILLQGAGDPVELGEFLNETHKANLASFRLLGDALSHPGATGFEKDGDSYLLSGSDFERLMKSWSALFDDLLYSGQLLYSGTLEANLTAPTRPTILISASYTDSGSNAVSGTFTQVISFRGINSTALEPIDVSSALKSLDVVFEGGN